MIIAKNVLPRSFSQIQEGVAKRYTFDASNLAIRIFGEIDEFWGVGLNQLAFDLQLAGGEPVDVQINSMGGSITEGIAMRNVLKGYNGEVRTTGVGLVASIATVVLLAGNDGQVRMANNAFFMIHEPTWWRGGTADELESQAETLKTMRGQIMQIYLDAIERNGKLINDSRDETEAQLDTWMKRETWFSAQSAFDAGFIDDIVEDIEFLTDDNLPVVEQFLNNCKHVPINFSKSIKQFKMAKNDQKNKGSIMDKIKALFVAEGIDISNAIPAKPNIEAQVKNDISVDDAVAFLREQGYQVDSPANEEATETMTVEQALEVLKKQGYQIDTEEAQEDNTGETQEETVEEDEAVVAMRAELDALKNENTKLRNKANGRSLGITKPDGAKKQTGFNAEQIKQLDGFANFLQKRARLG